MESIHSFIRDIPNFPKPGILYKDITPLLANKRAFRLAIEQMGSEIAGRKINYVVGVESRGFIFASALAFHLDLGLILVRKPNKLPYQTSKIEYALEYGNDTLEIHVDAVRPTDRVVIVDDILATGGTAKATAELIEQVGGTVDSLLFLADLKLLRGREKLSAYEVITLMSL